MEYTIIPPHTTAHGSTEVLFCCKYTMISKATDKGASHGPVQRTGLKKCRYGCRSPLPEDLLRIHTAAVISGVDLIYGISN
jgi:hypothetical protein